MKLKEGDKAPFFSLPDQNGIKHDLNDYKGKWLILYFYPKDDTPGCTKEACSFRDYYSEFRKRNIEIIGISTDSAEKHAKFAEKYNLPFTLLSDSEKKVVKLYGVWGTKILGAKVPVTKRTTFLINPSGEIIHIYEKVSPAEHADEILNELAKTENKK